MRAMGTTIIVCTLIAIGSFFGGGEYRHWQDCKLPPRTVYETHEMKTTIDTTSKMQNTQDQYTFIFNCEYTNKYFNINVNGTNVIFNFSKTNIQKKSNK